MPTYSYRCTACGNEFDIRQSFSDDPLTEAMRGLIAGTAVQDHQIALLWQAVETLSRRANADCLPEDASRRECFDADKLRELVDK